ncbi:hypothetical protein COXBURSA334_1370 [Coxiella burnetii Q321]|nr:hypothetical protein COXBURSA334_1370 [Coxiella burnetii Q321]
MQIVKVRLIGSACFAIVFIRHPQLDRGQRSGGGDWFKR